MSPRPHYQVEKAVVALQRLVSEGSLSPGSRLPSIAGLAKAAGVSKLTMWKAVSRLKDLGEFAGEPGKRIYVSRGSSQEYSLPPASGAADAYRDIPPSQKWQKVKSRILNDILNGSIRRDAPLPGFKEMQYRYGISFRTLKKSLDQLCHEKILEPSKRGYSVVTHGQDLSHVRVIYLAPSSRSGGIVRNLYVHMLEEISAQRRVNLEVQSFEPLQEPPQFRKYGTDKNVSPYNRDDALGYILLVTGLAGISDDLLSRLRSLMKLEG
jgi:DNA-binding GntR family transcriptional regulator